jgi:hypothetical protein
MLWLSVPMTLIAQDFRAGYIINQNGDSTKGFVSYGAGKKYLNYCSFRPTKRGKTVRYTPQELKAYGIFGDKKFVTFTIPADSATKPIFARVIVAGPLTLYRYGSAFVVQKKDSMVALPVPERQIIETPKGRMFKEDKRYVGVLNVLLSDCQLSADQTDYSEGDLTALVNNYNRCHGVEPADRKLRPLARLDGEVFGGYQISNLSTQISEELVFSPTKTIVGGVGLDYSSPRIFDRLFISAEVWYVKAFYQSYIAGPFSGTYRHKDTFFDVVNVRVPLGIRYNLLRESNTPYVKAGFVITPYQKIKAWSIVERESALGLVFTDNYEGGYDIVNPRGIWISAGYDQLVIGRTKLFFEFRYEDLDAFIGTPIQTFSSLKNLNFLLGVRF